MALPISSVTAAALQTIASQAQVQPVASDAEETTVSTSAAQLRESTSQMPISLTEYVRRNESTGRKLAAPEDDSEDDQEKQKEVPRKRKRQSAAAGRDPQAIPQRALAGGNDSMATGSPTVSQTSRVTVATGSATPTSPGLTEFSEPIADAQLASTGHVPLPQSFVSLPGAPQKSKVKLRDALNKDAPCPIDWNSQALQAALQRDNFPEELKMVYEMRSPWKAKPDHSIRAIRDKVNEERSAKDPSAKTLGSEEAIRKKFTKINKIVVTTVKIAWATSHARHGVDGLVEEDEEKSEYNPSDEDPAQFSEDKQFLIHIDDISDYQPDYLVQTISLEAATRACPDWARLVKERKYDHVRIKTRKPEIVELFLHIIDPKERDEIPVSTTNLNVKDKDIYGLYVLCRGLGNTRIGDIAAKALERIPGQMIRFFQQDSVAFPGFPLYDPPHIERKATKRTAEQSTDDLCTKAAKRNRKNSKGLSAEILNNPIPWLRDLYARGAKLREEFHASFEAGDMINDVADSGKRTTRPEGDFKLPSDEYGREDVIQSVEQPTDYEGDCEMSSDEYGPDDVIQSVEQQTYTPQLYDNSELSTSEDDEKYLCYNCNERFFFSEDLAAHKMICDSITTPQDSDEDHSADDICS